MLINGINSVNVGCMNQGRRSQGSVKGSLEPNSIEKIGNV